MSTPWHLRLAVAFLLLWPFVLMAQSGGAVSRLEVQPWTGPALPARTAGGFACETPAGILFAGFVPGGDDKALPVWFLPRGGEHWESSAVAMQPWAAGAAWGGGWFARVESWTASRRTACNLSVSKAGA